MTIDCTDLELEILAFALDEFAHKLGDDYNQMISTVNRLNDRVKTALDTQPPTDPTTDTPC